MKELSCLEKQLAAAKTAAVAALSESSGLSYKMAIPQYVDDAMQHTMSLFIGEKSPMSIF